MSRINKEHRSVSDISLREEIINKLANDHRTARVEIRVGVLDTIAHLAGTVNSLEIRTAAETIASGVENIRGVVNRIQAPGSPAPSRTIHLSLNDEK